jgi:hypothetical protein
MAVASSQMLGWWGWWRPKKKKRKRGPKTKGFDVDGNEKETTGWWARRPDAGRATKRKMGDIRKERRAAREGGGREIVERIQTGRKGVEGVAIQ